MEDKKTERKQCPACAREVKDHWNFCSYCGAQLKEEIILRDYKKFKYTKDDFLTCEPYKFLYQLRKFNPFGFEIAIVQIKENARAVGFEHFNTIYSAYVEYEQSFRKEMAEVLDGLDRDELMQTFGFAMGLKAKRETEATSQPG